MPTNLPSLRTFKELVCYLDWPLEDHRWDRADTVEIDAVIEKHRGWPDAFSGSGNRATAHE